MAQVKSAKNGRVQCDARLDGKTVIVTGANTGIGLPTSIDLAKRGAKIIMGCRSAERAQKARDTIIQEAKCDLDKVVFKQLDLASLTSVRKFAADVIASEQRLDILINNAGIMACPKMKTEDGFEMQFGVNHLGHFLLTNLLLDLLKKSAPSRIVVLSSIAHTSGKVRWDDINWDKRYDEWESYQASKCMNVLFARHLTKLVNGTGVTVNSVHPGIVKTELLRHNMGGGVKFWVRILRCCVQLPGVESCIGFIEPDAGAQTSIYVAIAPELEGVSGKYFADCKIKTESAYCRSDKNAERLWKLSAECTKLSKNG